MGVVVQYQDGSHRWCESCADPSDSGGSVVQGGTEHNAGGGTVVGSTPSPGDASGGVGPGGHGAPGTQAAQATAQDTKSFPTFYPQLNSNGGGYGGFNPSGTSGSGPGYGGLAAPQATTSTPSAPTSNPATGGGSSAQALLPGQGGFSGFAGDNDPRKLEWQFDPAQPQRSVSNAMSMLGLPTYGPLADFFSRYGIPGVAQALASGDFYNPDTFKQAMLNRMNGQASSMDSASIIRSLMGGEGLANTLSTAPNGVTTDPISSARAADIGAMESSPGDLANLLAAGLATGGPGGASTSIAGILGSFLGNIATRRQNMGNSSNDTLQYLGHLLGY